MGNKSSRAHQLLTGLGFGCEGIAWVLGWGIKLASEKSTECENGGGESFHWNL